MPDFGVPPHVYRALSSEVGGCCFCNSRVTPNGETTHSVTVIHGPALVVRFCDDCMRVASVQAMSASSSAAPLANVPWSAPEFNGWRIVGCNHYMSRERQLCLFIAMTNSFGRCAMAEGADEKLVFEQLRERILRADAGGGVGD